MWTLHSSRKRERAPLNEGALLVCVLETKHMVYHSKYYCSVTPDNLFLILLILAKSLVDTSQ